MKKIEFVIGNARKRIVIDTVKYIHIQNNYDYWFINKCISYCTDKIEKTDYFLEETGSINILIDEKEITKHEEIVRVNHHFNLEDDLKCGSKSLALRYLQKTVDNKLLSEEIIQINSFLGLIGELLSDDIVGFEPVDLNQKTLPKILTSYIKRDENIINSLDMSYEEIIELQIKFVMNSLNGSKQTIIFIELVELTDRLRKLFDSIQDVLVIVLFNNFSTEISNNFVIDGIDLEDEEELYERMINMTYYLNINEYRKNIITRSSLLINK